MATVAQLLDIARAELGTTESPAGSNKVKYSTWYGLTGPWCVMFVMWCCNQAGVELPNPVFQIDVYSVYRLSSQEFGFLLPLTYML